MRVGIVIYGDLSTASGGYLYDRMLVGAFQRAGDTVDVFSFPPGRYGERLLQNFSGELRRTIFEWSGDLLLQDELNHPSLFLLNRGLRRPGGIPVVSIVHHLRSSEAHPRRAQLVYRRVERSYLDSVDAFVFNSHSTRRSVEQLLGRAAEGIVATPGGDRLGPGPTEKEVLRRATAEGPLRVLFVGNIIPRKGLLTVIEALGKIPRGLWRLTIAGSRGMDPVYAREVDRAITAGGLGKNVSATGPLDDALLARAYSEHQVLAVPSQYEGFGIVYLEAMGFGLVPIGTRVGGAAEVIEDEISGCLVPPGDAAALSVVIEDLAVGRARLRALAGGALRRFRAFPGWGRGMAVAREHLCEIAARRGAKHE
jgi:glycosyltransferase involved in cell wall biosynthesis